jgi:hypothetical protein
MEAGVRRARRLFEGGAITIGEKFKMDDAVRVQRRQERCDEKA